MKVKELIGKSRLAAMPVTFIENGKSIEETTAIKINDNHPFKDRTVNCFEVKDNKFVVWIKPINY